MRANVSVAKPVVASFAHFFLFMKHLMSALSLFGDTFSDRNDKKWVMSQNGCLLVKSVGRIVSDQSSYSFSSAFWSDADAVGASSVGGVSNEAK